MRTGQSTPSPETRVEDEFARIDSLVEKYAQAIDEKGFRLAQGTLSVQMYRQWAKDKVPVERVQAACEMVLALPTFQKVPASLNRFLYISDPLRGAEIRDMKPRKSVTC